MFQLPSSTLRYYEDSGLLPPVERNPSGQRVYTDTHVERLHKIRCFKNTGMTIAQLQTFFNYEADELNHIDDVLELLSNQEVIVHRQLDELQKDYAHLQKKLRYYGAMKDCMEKNLPLPCWKDYE